MKRSSAPLPPQGGGVTKENNVSAAGGAVNGCNPVTVRTVVITPSAIMKVGFDHWSSRTFLAAVEMELYTELAATETGCMSAAEIRDTLCLCDDIRRTYDFCDTLVTLGKLIRSGNGDSAVYHNTPETSFFLDKAKDTYTGDLLEKAGTELYPMMEGYTAVLKDPTSTEDPLKRIDDSLREFRKTCKNISAGYHHSCEALLFTAFRFASSRALLTAAEIDLYSALISAPGGGGKMTNAQIADTLNLSPVLTPTFTKRLVSLRMLTSEGRGETALYSCTKATALYLDRAKPNYLGGFLSMMGERIYKFWSTLPEGLQTGEPQNEVKLTGRSVFEDIYASPEQLEAFTTAMAAVSAPSFESFAKNFDFSKYKTHLDMGGSTGVLACVISQEQPHMTMCTTADLPPMQCLAEKWIKRRGCEERVTAISFDFLTDEAFPRADLITMGYILHDWNINIKKMLIRKAYEALPDEGGTFVTIDAVIDDERRQNTTALTMSLNMLIETGTTTDGHGGGFAYTHSEFDEWCMEIGFGRTEAVHLPGTGEYNLACIAYK